MKTLIIGAMYKELSSLISKYKFKLQTRLQKRYPLYSARIGKNQVFILQTHVGSINASIASSLAILNVKPDITCKVGCVGANSQGIHKNDLIIALGFFQNNTWITRSKHTNSPTLDASKWQSLFGTKPYQVSKDNLGNTPYFFKPDEALTRKLIKIVKEFNVKYSKSYIGSGDIWLSDIRVLRNINNLLNQKDGSWVADMESFSIAQVCHVFNVPFIGIYFVSDNILYKNEQFNPNQIKRKSKSILLPIIHRFLFQ
jgi:adenosylhomocysteine nucleosidase